MKNPIAIAPLAVLLSVVSPSAWADETWICAYQLQGAQALPELYRLVVKGQELTVQHANPFLIEAGPFQVLKDDAASLVAVYIFPSGKTTDEKPHLGTQTLLIDKRTGSHLIASVYFDSPLHETDGACIAK